MICIVEIRQQLSHITIVELNMLDGVTQVRHDLNGQI
jgi:hypothetical protein